MSTHFLYFCNQPVALHYKLFTHFRGKINLLSSYIQHRKLQAVQSVYNKYDIQIQVNP